MKTLGLLLAGFLFVSLLVGAGEVITNDTGEDASGLRISFSSLVLITGFGDSFTSVSPQMLSYDFTFSGGVVEPFGSNWVSWAPLTASIVGYEWIRNGLSTAAVFEKEQFGERPQLPHALQDIVYGYLNETRDCCGEIEHQIPIYVSVPADTPISDIFCIQIGKDNPATLIRVDEVTLVTGIDVREVPASLNVAILRNGELVADHIQIDIENGFQAITIPLSTLPSGESTPELPADFIKAAWITDVWGTYFYGSSLEGENGSHHRDFFEPTCAKLAEDGFTDVYVATTFRFTEVSPLPRLEMGANTMAIDETDLRKLVEIAHAYGLRLHISFFAGTEGSGHAYLSTTEHPDSWLRSFFTQYTELMEAQAAIAVRCGVDSFVLGHQAAGINYDGNPELWYESWARTIKQIDAAWPGQLEFCINDYGMIFDIQAGKMRYDDFAGIDSFMISQWFGSSRSMESYSDSLASLHAWYANWLDDEVRWLSEFVKRPVALSVGIQSTDGYMRNGWSDVAVGIIDETTPDFFEQSRSYEALLQAISELGVFDGIIVGKYHWDDPFGPDFEPTALARMDLSGSVRNKPAEAILKRWFSGRSGPVGLPSSEAAWITARPWCPDLYLPWEVYETPGDHIPSGRAAELLGPLTWVDLPLQVDWLDDSRLQYGLYQESGNTLTHSPDPRFQGHGLDLSTLRGGEFEWGLAFYIQFEAGEIASTDNRVAYVLEFEPGGQEVTIVAIQGHLGVGAPINEKWEWSMLPNEYLEVSSTGIGIVLPYELVESLLPRPEDDSFYEIGLRVAYRGDESQGYVRYPGTITIGNTPESRYGLDPATERATRVIDDFESFLGGVDAGEGWAYGSSEKYNPGSDPDSYCLISPASSPAGGTCLRAEFLYTSWMKVGLTDFLDASDYDGIEVSLWSETPMRIDIELGICVDQWTTHLVRGIGITSIPTRFRIPFDDFVHEPDMDSLGIPDEHLARVCGVGFLVNSEGVKNILYIDDVSLYRD